jgi:hypothetical protein
MNLNPITPMIEAGTRLVGTIFGSKQERDAADADSRAAAQGQYAAEFQDRTNRTWFDSFMDGLNRFVRPAITLYFAWLILILPISDLEHFANIMLGYSAVPEALWILFGTIVSFYFGGRVIEKIAVTKADVARAKDVAKELKDKKRVGEGVDIDGLPWLDNPSIKAWKEKKGG